MATGLGSRLQPYGTGPKQSRSVLSARPWEASPGLLISSALVQTPSSQCLLICRTLGMSGSPKGQAEGLVLDPGLSWSTSSPNLPQLKDGAQDFARCTSLSPRISEKLHGSCGPIWPAELRFARLHSWRAHVLNARRFFKQHAICKLYFQFISTIIQS